MPNKHDCFDSPTTPNSQSRTTDSSFGLGHFLLVFLEELEPSIPLRSPTYLLEREKERRGVSLFELLNFYNPLTFGMMVMYQVGLVQLHLTRRPFETLVTQDKNLENKLNGGVP